MIVVFSKTYLKELYEKGATRDKKRRFQPEIINRYKRCIQYLMSAPSKESLYPVNSLNFKALSGDKAGLFSVRVNSKYRIEFTLEETTEDPILTICNIVELSNHYD